MSGRSQLTSPEVQQHGGESGSRPELPTAPPQSSADEDALSSNTCARTHEHASALEPMLLPACIGTTFDVPGVPPPSLPSSEPCRDHALRNRPREATLSTDIDARMTDMLVQQGTASLDDYEFDYDSPRAPPPSVLFEQDDRVCPGPAPRPRREGPRTSGHPLMLGQHESRTAAGRPLGAVHRLFSSACDNGEASSMFRRRQDATAMWRTPAENLSKE